MQPCNDAKTVGLGSTNPAQAFSKSGVRLAGKVAGIHWWYKSEHHAAELTSGRSDANRAWHCAMKIAYTCKKWLGYYNADGNDGYDSIAAVFQTVGAGIDFTCMASASLDSAR